MALVKPIMLSVMAFDATMGHTFSFTSNGGDQVVANQLTIKRQDTNKIVYQNKITSYAFEHKISTNVLENGYYYSAYFNTYNVKDEESEASNETQFNCYDTPTLVLTNLPQDGLVDNSNYIFGATYNQIQGEMLNSMKFELYDHLGNLIDESDLYCGTSVLPITFEHTFSGFNNNESYYVKAIATSVDGIKVETEKYSFTVRYSYPSMFNLLDLVNVCEKGYVKIESNVESIEGETAPEFTPPTYLNAFQVTDPSIYVQWGIPFEYDMENLQPISEWTELSLIDLHQLGNWVKWEKGFNIPTNFTFTSFMKVGRLGTFAIIGDENNGFKIDLIREIPSGQNTVKDRFEVNGYVNGELKVHQASNYVDILNQSSYYLIWFRKVNNVYELIFNVIEKGKSDIMDWGESSVWYDRITDISWNPESYPQGTEFESLAENISGIFPLTKLKLFNGIYDNIDITSDVSSEFSTKIPQWTYSTRIDCNFNKNINGGNLDTLLSQIKYIKVKRRKKGTFDWIILKQYPVQEYKDLNIVTEDYFVPSDYEAEYAIVPVSDGGIEGTYIINDIITKFACVTIADNEKAFSLKANIVYGGDVKNATFSTYEPLKGKYYIVQRNGELDSYTGSISMMVTGYNFDKTHQIDRQDVLKMTDDLCEFFNNGRAKILKDWNGKIHMVRFLGSPQITYNSSYGNGVAYVSANWAEQGQFDSQNDLYYNGLTDVLS